MRLLNNLTYELHINYINNEGLNVSICVTIYDNGLESNSVRIGDVCVTEETINGRVLSGRYDENNMFCGYRYNYEKNNDEYLISINPAISINEATSLINKSKMDSKFLSAKMALSSIMRDDYRVFTIQKGNLNITKTIFAENENAEMCFYQEIIELIKKDGELSFTELHKEKVYKIDDKCIVEDDTNSHAKTKSQLKELLEIINQRPNNYKKLNDAKNKAFDVQEKQ